MSHVYEVLSSLVAHTAPLHIDQVFLRGNEKKTFFEGSDNASVRILAMLKRPIPELSGVHRINDMKGLKCCIDSLRGKKVKIDIINNGHLAPHTESRIVFASATATFSSTLAPRYAFRELPK